MYTRICTCVCSHRKNAWKLSVVSCLAADNSSCTPDCCLFVFLSVYLSLSVCLSVCLTVCLSVCLSVCVSVCQSVCLSVCLSVCPSVRPSVCLLVCLFFCQSVCMSAVRLSISVYLCLFSISLPNLFIFFSRYDLLLKFPLCPDGPRAKGSPSHALEAVEARR